MKKVFFLLLVLPLLTACLYGQSIIPLDENKYLVQVYGEAATFEMARKELRKQALSRCQEYILKHESKRVVDPWNGVDEFQWIIECR